MKPSFFLIFILFVSMVGSLPLMIVDAFIEGVLHKKLELADSWWAFWLGLLTIAGVVSAIVYYFSQHLSWT